MYKIWFEGAVPDEYRHLFEAVATGISPGAQVKRDPYHQLERADAVIAGGRLYDAAALARAPRLLIIARTGVGYDKVDIAAASARHIAVVNAPDAPTISTAEQAITLMMTIARSIKRVENELARMLESGAPKNIWGEYVALEMRGKQLGLVGLGRIGGHVSGIARAIGMRVAAYDPHIAAERFAALGVEKVESLADLLSGVGQLVLSRVKLRT